MSYGFNSDTYIVLKNVRYYDSFQRITKPLHRGDRIGSGVCNQIIIDEDTYGIANGQSYINQLVLLGYVSVV